MRLLKRTVLFLFVLSFALGPLLGAELSPEEQGWVKRAIRADTNGWIYLHLEGRPFVRGFQHGYLLAGDIAEGLRVARRMTWWDTGKDWSFFVRETLAMFGAKIDPELREEMEGITAGARRAGVKIDYGDIVLLNASSEIMGYWYPWSREGGGTPPRAGGCSAFIATGKATLDGRIVMAHNTWASYATCDSHVVIDLQPDQGFRILMQSFPAGIHSDTDFFICSSGLVGTETTIDAFKGFDPEGIPEFVRIRRAMQYASGLDECLKTMIEGNNGGYANTWLLGDTGTNEIARLELGLRHHSVERTRDGFYCGSNITENIPLLREETDSEIDNIKRSNVARRVRWLELFEEWKGRVDVEAAKLMLADHYDVYAGRVLPGDRTICGHFELAPDPDGPPGDSWAKPYYPGGALDGKVVDAQMAREMSFWGRWGSSCGLPFDADKFLKAHRQYGYLAGYLKSRPTEPWMIFKSWAR
jgi:hypothetical protein